MGVVGEAGGMANDVVVVRVEKEIIRISANQIKTRRDHAEHQYVC